MISVRTLALLVATGALALSGGFAAHYVFRGEPGAAGALSDEADIQGLFAAALPDLGGTPTSVGHWRGKLLVVNFWATWCAPCREEIPEFVRLQTEFSSKGVQFVGIAADQADKVAIFAQELKINYPVLIGNYGALELAKRVGNRGSVLPFTIVIDRNAKIVHRQAGILTPTKLRSLFSETL